MTLTISLTPEEEARLQAAAQSQGVDAVECLRRLLTTYLPPASSSGTATSELFAAWAKEDATDDPAEIERREQEWEEFREAVNANRRAAGERPVYP